LPCRVHTHTWFGVRRLVDAAFGFGHAALFARARASAKLYACAAAIVLACFSLWAASAARPDEPAYDTVGAIEGEAISVQGPLKIEVVQGRTRTILRSGSDIRVKSGDARIDLVEGGQIAICGPAHLSVLKSVNLLTLALDTGTIHAHIEHAPTLTIYTAQLQAKLIPIGDAPQDALVGFDAAGAMCIRATSGAVRVEHQLTAQSVIVPQGADILVSDGQLDTVRSSAGHCSCEVQLAKTAPPPPQIEVSRLAAPTEIQEAQTERSKAPSPAQKPIPAKEDPVYQVFMPPLSYDATAKVQPDNFDPQLIVLVRRIRVRPTLIFRGSVEGEPLLAKNAAPASAVSNPPATSAPPQKNPQTSNTVMNRVRAFFHWLFS
jgi:hypothetical protein